MNRQTLRWGCLIGGALILLLLALGGGGWYLRQSQTEEAPDTSPVLVFLLSPSSGAEIEAGNFVEITLQAVAPASIVSAELFVDGQSLGAITGSPEYASWTWQAWPTGIHTLSARATAADGQLGQSQTVIVNILAREGPLGVVAEEGQTLEQVGAAFGVGPDQMAAANPYVDPSQPLAGGQPVQVPVSGGASTGSEQDGGVVPPTGGPAGDLTSVLIKWHFKPTGPVDKSYCYTSTGNGLWEKIPKAPFNFVAGALTSYTQVGLIFPDQKSVIRVQCWGWLGDALKFLGEGETQFDVQSPPGEVTIEGEGFALVGVPQFPNQQDESTGGGFLVPPPFALRETTSAAECAAHGNPILMAFICDTLLDPSSKKYIVLVWEWEPKTCWTGDCPWISEINGYRIYEIDPYTKAEKLLKEIDHRAQRATAVPLPWGTPCYGVRAYVNDPAIAASEMSTFCPGQPLAPQKLTLTPTHWLTTGGTWYQDGDCDWYGSAGVPLSTGPTGFGTNPGDVQVGTYDVDDDDGDCYREGKQSGGVKFGEPALPENAVIQKAVLRLSEISTKYNIDGVGTNYKLFCVASVSKAKQDWTALNAEFHYLEDDILGTSAYYTSPFTSLSPSNNAPEIDVTSIVKHWILHPENNHGFILNPYQVQNPLVDGSSNCMTNVGNEQIDIFFFTP